MCKRYPISNRYVFAKVMQDNPDLCQEMIERILGMKVGHIKTIEVESESTSIIHRGVRFDVFLKGDEAAFEVEMQTYEQEDLPRRMRFYRSQLDRRMLGKGEAFGGLKPVYIIFICLQDYFGSGLPVYTFESTCREDPTVAFENGVHDIVLCADGDLSRAPADVAALLKYVATNTVESDDSLTGRLAQAVEDAYRDEEWVSSMSKLDWDIADARRYAAAEGHAKGLEEGRAEGREEGRAEGRKEGLAEGIASERDREAALMKAMLASGMDASSVIAALRDDNRDALYSKYLSN